MKLLFALATLLFAFLAFTLHQSKFVTWRSYFLLLALIQRNNRLNAMYYLFVEVRKCAHHMDISPLLGFYSLHAP